MLRLIPLNVTMCTRYLCYKYSWLSVTRTLSKSNLPLTRSKCFFLSGLFLYNFTLDNCNSQELEPFLISFEGSSYQKSTACKPCIPCVGRTKMELTSYMYILNLLFPSWLSRSESQPRKRFSCFYFFSWKEKFIWTIGFCGKCVHFSLKSDKYIVDSCWLPSSYWLKNVLQ